MVTAYLHNDYGCAYYYEYENNVWVQKQQIIPYTSQNGTNFGISMDYHDNFACFASYNDLVISMILCMFIKKTKMEYGIHILF